jgi:pilus assembly protein CpaE
MPDLNEAEDRVIAPVPRVTIQAFCETPDVANAIQSASSDRRMHKVHVKIQMGGASAAVEAYRSAPTPNVIILESHNDRASLLQHLDALSEFCDAGTKLVVIGHVNDVILYRELIRRGVSDYLIAPTDTLDIVRTVSELFSMPGAAPVGRVTAVVGAKAAPGRRRSPITCPGRPRGAWGSRPWWSISTSRSDRRPELQPGSAARASPTRFLRPSASMRTCSTAFCRGAATT